VFLPFYRRYSKPNGLYCISSPLLHVNRLGVVGYLLYFIYFLSFVSFVLLLFLHVQELLVGIWPSFILFLLLFCMYRRHKAGTVH
jgi:hypothetical protein